MVRVVDSTSPAWSANRCEGNRGYVTATRVPDFSPPPCNAHGEGELLHETSADFHKNTHRDQREVLHQRCPFGIRQLACTLVAHPAMDTTATTEDPQEVLEPEIL